MRRVTTSKYVPLTVVLAFLSAAVLAVSWPVSAFADDPVVGDTTTTPTVPTSTVPAPMLTPNGDLITPSEQSQPVSLPGVTTNQAFLAHMARKMRHLRSRIRRYRQDAVYWAQIMGSSVRQIHKRRLAAMGLTALRHKAVEWKRLDNQTRFRAQHPPHLAAWLCIHHYEGSWTANTGNGYYGGVQMNLDFQRAYGPWLLRKKGTADHWTPLEQIWTAVKAEKSRGFWPWPNTARACGLL